MLSLHPKPMSGLGLDDSLIVENPNSCCWDVSVYIIAASVYNGKTFNKSRASHLSCLAFFFLWGHLIYVPVLYNLFSLMFLLPFCRIQTPGRLTDRCVFSCRSNDPSTNGNAASEMLQHLTAGVILQFVLMSCKQPIDVLSHSQHRHAE